MAKVNLKKILKETKPLDKPLHALRGYAPDRRVRKTMYHPQFRVVEAKRYRMPELFRLYITKRGQAQK